MGLTAKKWRAMCKPFREATESFKKFNEVVRAHNLQNLCSR